MEEFLNTIGLDEDNMVYFENSNIEKVSINKKNNRFNFIINIENSLPLKVYNDLKNIPSKFPPTIHTHNTVDINDYEESVDMDLNALLDFLSDEIRKE